MGTRVLSTDEARAAITHLQTIVSSGLAGQLSSLTAEGHRLCDPNVWDGNEAVRFRNELWPGITRALQQATTALGDLRTYIAQVNQNIMTAGGNG